MFHFVHLTLMSLGLHSFFLMRSTAVTENGREYLNAEVEALKEMRPMVEKFLLKDYMRDDEFLLPFLKATNLNVKDGAKMVLTTMKWREENNIDNVMDEENTVEKDLPYTFAMDRKKRPVILVKVGESDLRKILLAGKIFEAERVCWKIIEGLARKARVENVSEVVGVVDLNGFTYRQHACRQCIPFGQHLAQAIERNYPRLAAKVFIINSPRVFEVILNIIRSVMSESTVKVLSVYGYNKEEWMEALLEYISPHQLSLLFRHKFSLIKSPQRTSNQRRHELSKNVRHFEEDDSDDKEVDFSQGAERSQLHSKNSSAKLRPFLFSLLLQLFFLLFITFSHLLE